MNLQDLRYLVAVADHRHFGRAAESCFVSQPTLSTQIRKLERELGVELVERNPRHITLTTVGEAVVERARLVVAEADAIKEVARRASDPDSGTLRVGLFPTLAPYLLPHIVPVLHERYPKVELLLVEEKSGTIHAQLRSGDLDLGLLALPVNDPNLVSERVFAEDFLLAVPASDALAVNGGPVSTEVLAGEDVLLLEEGHCLRDQALSVCQIAGAAERAGFRATSLETLRQMVAAGVGVTLLPELAVLPPVPASTDIALLRFTDPVPNREIGLFWRPTSPYAEMFPSIADVIRDVAGDLTGHPLS